MRVLKLRALIFLSTLYLGLVALLYHFLWQRHTLEKLFESPGQQSSVPEDYDYPNTTNEFVQFNFKRQNPLKLANSHNFGKEGGGEELQRGGTPSRLAYSREPQPKESQLGSQTPSLDSSNASSDTVPRAGELGTPAPNYCLHAFYYVWYGNTEVDGRYLHWNHRYLPHWDKKVAKRYPDGRHDPPDDIGANFYPKLGCYSSRDPVTMESHMVQLRKAGVGVIAVSWYPSGMADDEGTPPDLLIPQLLDTAQKYAIKVAVHIEPYRRRTPQTVRGDLKYIHKHYSTHPAIYKLQSQKQGDTRRLLAVYIYDSYLSPAHEWAKVFKTDGTLSVRDTEYDCVAISLLVEEKHKQFVLEGGFDGFYTYFASDGFSHGSSPKNWQALSRFAEENQILFIPSMGPGYEDTRVRPWNSRNSKGRRDGQYYKAMFDSALRHHHGAILSITSFNEWHEGTQIEPAVPRSSRGYTYMDYSPHSPDYYLELTRGFSQQLDCSHTDGFT